MNIFEDFFDFFFSRSFLIVLLLTALLALTKRLSCLRLSEVSISSSSLDLQGQETCYTQQHLRIIVQGQCAKKRHVMTNKNSKCTNPMVLAGAGCAKVEAYERETVLGGGCPNARTKA
jgi:hypothetical protein